MLCYSRTGWENIVKISPSRSIRALMNELKISSRAGWQYSRLIKSVFQNSFQTTTRAGSHGFFFVRHYTSTREMEKKIKIIVALHNNSHIARIHKQTRMLSNERTNGTTKFNSLTEWNNNPWKELEKIVLRGVPLSRSFPLLNNVYSTDGEVKKTIFNGKSSLGCRWNGNGNGNTFGRRHSYLLQNWFLKLSVIFQLWLN